MRSTRLIYSRCRTTFRPPPHHFNDCVRQSTLGPRHQNDGMRQSTFGPPPTHTTRTIACASNILLAVHKRCFVLTPAMMSHGCLAISVIAQAFVSVMKRLCYAGVTPGRRGKGWIAQNRRPRLWKSGFRSQVDAARWLASKLGVLLSSLARSSRRESSGVVGKHVVSKYRGVVVRRRHSGVLYEARVLVLAVVWY